MEGIVAEQTGRQLGAMKSAAKKCGCSPQDWAALRLAGHRWCFRCKQWKPADVFSKDRSRNGGHTSSCKECTSDASTASRYGMTLEELHAFRAEHKHQCGICAASEILYIDHDHATGKPRGLLCPNCNTAIGRFREDPALFAAALAYLEKHRGSTN
jgi:hypothetical protein